MVTTHQRPDTTTTPLDSSAQASAAERQTKAAAEKAAESTIDLEKASLAHVTAKVADGPEAGVASGQVVSQAMRTADTEIAQAAGTTKARPDVVAAFREEIRAKVLELAITVETKIREVLQQRQAPSQIAQENTQREKDVIANQQRRDRELSLQW